MPTSCCWAVGLRHTRVDGKEESLFVSFNHNGAQAEFVNLLKQAGYPVSSAQFLSGQSADEMIPA